MATHFSTIPALHEELLEQRREQSFDIEDEKAKASKWGAVKAVPAFKVSFSASLEEEAAEVATSLIPSFEEDEIEEVEEEVEEVEMEESAEAESAPIEAITTSVGPPLTPLKLTPETAGPRGFEVGPMFLVLSAVAGAAVAASKHLRPPSHA